MEKGSMQSNLDCFLNCTTPLVPSQFLAKSEIRNLNRLWHPWETEKVEYFKLADLWNCFDEWSAYGAGIPIRLDTGETLVQYYVPYLSAIQIFTSTSPANFLREEAESVCEMRDSFSDSLSDESENEKLSRWDGCSSEEGVVEQDSLSRTNDRLGYLYFQYFERCTPYGRVPLMDKINGFAERYPGLMSLRSVDLSPASWMAVAWYPIYHIPMGRTIKDLSTCFLTFHTLSSSFQDMDLEDDMENGSRKRKEGESISLPPFGLATYKMQGDVWISDRSGRDQERLMSLFSVADSWLKQLGVQHHDFNYMSIRRG
uniref:Plant/F9H3-4 protein n=2 Tax=Solanum tuberosum TaxID=4113 RepID=M1BYI6_SOLTU